MGNYEKEANTRFLRRRAFVKMAGAGMLLTLAPPTLLGCGGVKDTLDAVLVGERRVVDDAGREVTIPTPDRLERIYFTGALAQIYCFSLAPDLLAGTGMQFTPYELEFLPEGTSELPFLGTTSGGGEVDREALLVEDVQLVFSISGTQLAPANISEAEDLQALTGIPCLCMDGSFERVSSCYQLLGDVLGQKKRAAELAAYCEDTLVRIKESVANIPEEEKITLYYAEGPEGLQTEPSSNHRGMAFSIAGANNVAAVEENQGIGMSNVSLEQVIQWDPEVIIAWDSVVRGGADKRIRTNSNWASIKAVQDGRVYTMPNAPFAWCDRPPGVNRFLGIQWVANILYPDLFDVDMVEVTKEFYSTFYWIEIDDEKAKELLGNSYPPRRG